MEAVFSTPSITQKYLLNAETEKNKEEDLASIISNLTTHYADGQETEDGFSSILAFFNQEPRSAEVKAILEELRSAEIEITDDINGEQKASVKFQEEHQDMKEAKEEALLLIMSARTPQERKYAQAKTSQMLAFAKEGLYTEYKEQVKKLKSEITQTQPCNSEPVEFKKQVSENNTKSEQLFTYRDRVLQYGLQDKSPEESTLLEMLNINPVAIASGCSQKLGGLLENDVVQYKLSVTPEIILECKGNIEITIHSSASEPFKLDLNSLENFDLFSLPAHLILPILKNALQNTKDPSVICKFISKLSESRALGGYKQDLKDILLIECSNCLLDKLSHIEVQATLEWIENAGMESYPIIKELAERTPPETTLHEFYNAKLTLLTLLNLKSQLEILTSKESEASDDDTDSSSKTIVWQQYGFNRTMELAKSVSSLLVQSIKSKKIIDAFAKQNIKTIIFSALIPTLEFIVKISGKGDITTEKAMTLYIALTKMAAIYEQCFEQAEIDKTWKASTPEALKALAKQRLLPKNIFEATAKDVFTSFTQPSGLAGKLVLPSGTNCIPANQFNALLYDRMIEVLCNLVSTEAKNGSSEESVSKQLVAYKELLKSANKCCVLCNLSDDSPMLIMPIIKKAMSQITLITDYNDETAADSQKLVQKWENMGKIFKETSNFPKTETVDEGQDLDSSQLKQQKINEFNQSHAERYLKLIELTLDTNVLMHHQFETFYGLFTDLTQLANDELAVLNGTKPAISYETDFKTEVDKLQKLLLAMRDGRDFTVTGHLKIMAKGVFLSTSV